MGEIIHLQLNHLAHQFDKLINWPFHALEFGENEPLCESQTGSTEGRKGLKATKSGGVGGVAS